jgi:shikimate kinase
VYRIHNTTKRPLLIDSENIQSRLKKIWEERKMFYKNSAHHIIDTDNLNPTQVLDKILNLLEIPLANC